MLIRWARLLTLALALALVVYLALSCVATVVRGASTPTVAYAKHYALDVLGPTQYRCLRAIGEYESRWNPLSRNPRSGAYGIFQALPASKMAKYGRDYLTNPVVQVDFGIAYAKARYGSACGGWAHILNYGWW